MLTAESEKYRYTRTTYLQTWCGCWVDFSKHISFTSLSLLSSRQISTQILWVKIRDTSKVFTALELHECFKLVCDCLSYACLCSLLYFGNVLLISWMVHGFYLYILVRREWMLLSHLVAVLCYSLMTTIF